MRKLIPSLAAGLLLLFSGSAKAQEVSTGAAACLLMDADSGRVLLSHNADTPLPMASTTKVMTALLAIELGNMDAPVTCSKNAYGVPGTSIYLSLGETLTLREMLYGLMLCSGNDAAVAIAEHIGGSAEEFCRMMTARAKELGCTNTVFLTPHGLPMEGHYTTARDLAIIARHAMTLPLFREIVGTTRATIPWEGRAYPRVLTNKNRLLTDYPGCTGIKTGYTKKAGRCLVFGARRDDMEVIGVVLNCYDWFDEAARLMNRAFENYTHVTMGLKGDCLRTVPVEKGTIPEVPALLGKDLSGVISSGAVPQVCIHLPESLSAPLHEGDVIGTACLMEGDEAIAEVPLCCGADVLEDDYAARWHLYWDNWLAVP